MAWYTTGSVSVTNGDTQVTGSGTNFLSNVKAGDIFAVTNDGMLYEIAEITSTTQLTLARTFAGSTDAAADYEIIPTTAQLKVLAQQIADLITLYSDVPKSAQDAQDSAALAQTYRDAAQEARTGAESARDVSLQAKDAAALSRDAAALSESNAGGSATTASSKASEASGYAQTATQAKSDSLSARDAAVTAQGAAETARDQAKQYADAAQPLSSTDDLAEGSTHLYFTQPRVITAIGGDFAADARSALGVYSTAQVDTAVATVTANANSRVQVYQENDALPTQDQGPIAHRGEGLVDWNGTRYVCVQSDHGQCRFGYVSATQCWLVPWGGNGLVINGRQYRVPSTGVYLSNTGLAAGTLYYVFAKDDGAGKIALETGLVSGGRVRHTDGVWIKTGDPTRTLVGMLATSSASQFVFAVNDYRVTSFFNRVPFAMGENIAGNLATTGPTRVGTGFNCMCWSDQILESQISDSSYVNGTPVGMYTAVYRSVNNGSTSTGMQILSPSPGTTSAGVNFASYIAVTVPHSSTDSIISMGIYMWEDNANYTRYCRCYHTLTGYY